MNWIVLSIFAYFLGALVVLLDKYLLKSQRISSPVVYAFYVGFAGLGVFLFAPLGYFVQSFQLYIPSIGILALCVISGMLFSAGLLMLYWAIHKSEASRVTPVVFSVIPLVTFVLAYFFEIEILSLKAIFGAVLLIFGGLLISFDLPLKKGKKKFFAGFYFSLFSGLLQGVSLVFLKQVYETLNFFNGFAWTRLGAFIGVCFLFLVTKWRKNIIKSFKHAGKKKKENTKTFGLFVLNKTLGGTSSALINMAIAIGSVTAISAMVSLQYVFVLVLALLGSFYFAHIFEERLYFWDWFQKVISIIIITVGMILIS